MKHCTKNQGGACGTSVLITVVGMRTHLVESLVASKCSPFLAIGVSWPQGRAWKRDQVDCTSLHFHDRWQRPGDGASVACW